MKLHVVVDSHRNPETGEMDEAVEEWEAEQASFLTEPSGALVIFRKPNDSWAAYAPGAWLKIREA